MKMKKILAVALVGAMAIGMFGCGGNKDANNDAQNGQDAKPTTFFQNIALCAPFRSAHPIVFQTYAPSRSVYLSRRLDAAETNWCYLTSKRCGSFI